MRILQKVLWFVVLTWCGVEQVWGQANRDNVFQTAFSAVTSGTGISAVMRNNGQSMHIISVVLANSGGACSATSASVAIQVSNDGTNYTNISQSDVLLNSLIGVSQGYGAYPFIRIRIFSFFVNCSYTVYYNGVVAPSGLVKPSSSYQTVGVNYSGAGVFALTSGAGAHATFRPVVYGVIITGDGTSVPTGFVNLATSTDNCVTAPTVLSNNFSVTTTGTIILPASTIPWYTGNVGSSLCVNSAIAMSGGTVSVIYRWE